MEEKFKREHFDRIFSLSDDETKKRELYLKDIANGKIQGPLTDIPFMDEPWLKEYDDEAITSIVPQMNMVDFLYENNKNNLDEIALVFEAKEITYGELFKNIDLYAQALMAHGYKKQDVIALPLPTTPESVYLFYAINKIGAVSNLIDLRKSKEEINYCLKQANTKGMFALDVTTENMVEAIKGSNIKEIVSLSAVESFPTPIQFLFNPKQFLKNRAKRHNIISLNEFINNFDKNVRYQYPEYEKEIPAFIVYTSGSTNTPKAVVLTSEVANDRVHQYMYNGMIYNRQDVYLNVIPLFLAFGSIVGLHLPLSMGMKDVIIPSYNIEKTLQLIKKWKPQHLSLTPASYVKLINSPDFSKLDLSNVYTWGSGGDGICAMFEKIINSKLQEQGSTQKMSNGYGGSEIGAPFATQKDGVTEPGSVGIPLPGNNVIIFDHYTREILPSGHIGDICMVVEHSMLEYLGKQELTDETIIKLSNGRVGILLKDAGYIDKNGYLYIKGRYSDVAKDSNDKIIWPIDLENSIMSTNMVQNCASITLNSKANKIGMFVVLNSGANKNDFELLLAEEMEKVGQDKVDYEIIYLNEIMLSENGKIDRKKLRNLYSRDEETKIM